MILQRLPFHAHPQHKLLIISSSRLKITVDESPWRERQVSTVDETSIEGLRDLERQLSRL